MANMLWDRLQVLEFGRTLFSQSLGTLTFQSSVLYLLGIGALGNIQSVCHGGVTFQTASDQDVHPLGPIHVPFTIDL